MRNISQFTEKLRLSGLRQTKQRISICKVLFDRNDTFHFTINDLTKILKRKVNKKISTATVYNTVHAFKNKGYLKQISIKSDKSYFDTNVSEHHHFFDEDMNKLIDLENKHLDKIKIKKKIPGKKIKSVEVLVKVVNNKQIT
jgi:Fur family iron response transcriptional regulator